MKRNFEETLEIPQGISCILKGNEITCSKGENKVSKKFVSHLVEVRAEGKNLKISCKKGNKRQYKIVKSYVAHLKNIFNGLEKPFTYELEAVNVHFPMTLKVEGNNIVITNYLGEKTPRRAKIMENVKVDVKGQKISISSPDREVAGQTASNFEKATRPRGGKDRRVFQDGIYIKSKPGSEK